MSKLSKKYLFIGAFILFFLLPVKSALATAPTISNLSVSTTDTTATVTWTTDQSSTSNINYGTSSDYTDSKSDSTLTTSHSMSLTGLTKGTTYHYNVESVSGSSESVESGDQTFNTTGSSTTTTIVVTAIPTPSATRPLLRHP